MTERCPHHRQTLNARVNDCRECDREAAQTDHEAGAAAVLAALGPRPHTADDHHQAAVERARAERADRSKTNE